MMLSGHVGAAQAVGDCIWGLYAGKAGQGSRADNSCLHALNAACVHPALMTGVPGYFHP